MLANSLSAKQREAADAQLAEVFGVDAITELTKVRIDKLRPAIQAALPLNYNELTQRIELNRVPIDDSFLQTLYIELAEEFLLDVSAKEAADAAVLVARRNPYHPVRDYISGLTERLPKEIWDNLSEYFYGEKDDWATLHLQRQLIACVARAFDPGCKLDTALVLFGGQGQAKSTQWEILGGDWFSGSLENLRNLKDDILVLHSAWIHEWGEIDTVVGKRESEDLKKFLSRRKDIVRRPYGRGTVELARSCAIVGTTNRDDWIKDHTGNRRFPIIRIRQLNSDWISQHRDAIWGMAYEQMMNGVKFWYSKEEEARISDEARSFTAEDPHRDNAEAFFDGFKGADFTIAQLAHHIEPDNYRAMSTEQRKKIGAHYARVCISLGATKTTKRERRHIWPGDAKPQQPVWLPPARSALSDDCPF